MRVREEGRKSEREARDVERERESGIEWEREIEGERERGIEWERD